MEKESDSYSRIVEGPATFPVGEFMQSVRRFRIPGLFCALAVLMCEVISHPYSDMGVCDDLPYILSAQKLAATGHIVYNGGATAMLGWQLYLGAALIKLFGFSLTTVRMSTLLVAMAMAFVLQRTLVRARISEWNATIGTLALVVSPLYLMLSATFMSDIHGLFAIVLCLYGCLRALQAASARAATGWLCFAVATNALCGTSRQIAWLGVLVMVPSTLWLLRAQRRVFVAGAAMTVAGAMFVFGCMHWFAQQPYALASLPLGLFGSAFPVLHVLSQYLASFLDVPLLLLPLIIVFLPEIRKSRLRVVAILCIVLLGYVGLALDPSRLHPLGLLEPTQGDWINVYGIYEGIVTQGTPPVFLYRGAQIVLTILSIGGLLALAVCLTGSWRGTREAQTEATFPVVVSWKQLGVLFAPFTLAYFLLLLPLSTIGLYDRYLLGPLVAALICLVRYYQDRIQPRLPVAAVLVVVLVAIYGVAVTHNMFALSRARAALAAEVRASGVPDTSVDNGWEYNWGVELEHAASINDDRITVPAHAVVEVSRPAGTCQMWWYVRTPHIHPAYAVSFDPNACYGKTTFAPVTYSQWLSSEPGTLYVVHFNPSSTR
jgi:hypothetical protein